MKVCGKNSFMPFQRGILLPSKHGDMLMMLKVRNFMTTDVK